MRNLSTLFVLLLCGITSISAQVLISDDPTFMEPHPESILHLQSDTKALLLPRLQAAPDNPTNGMIYFNVQENTFVGYADGEWVAFNGSQTSPSLLTFVEGFDEITIISSTYSTVNNFTGPDNTQWNCVARTNLDLYSIDGKGVMLNAPSTYCDITFPNGVYTLTFDYRGAYTGTSTNRNVVVLHGSTEIGNTGSFSANQPVTTLNPPIYVDSAEAITLRIRGTSAQAVVDNVTWTRYE